MCVNGKNENENEMMGVCEAINASIAAKKEIDVVLLHELQGVPTFLK